MVEAILHQLKRLLPACTTASRPAEASSKAGSIARYLCWSICNGESGWGVLHTLPSLAIVRRPAEEFCNGTTLEGEQGWDLAHHKLFFNWHLCPKWLRFFSFQQEINSFQIDMNDSSTLSCQDLNLRITDILYISMHNASYLIIPLVWEHLSMRL